MNVTLEEPVRPLILKMRLGVPLSLEVNDCALLSRWIIKNALLRAILRAEVKGEEFPTVQPASKRTVVSMWRQVVIPLIYEAEMPRDSLIRVGLYATSTGTRPARSLDLLPGRFGGRCLLSTVDRVGPMLFETSLWLDRSSRLARWSNTACKRLLVIQPIYPTAGQRSWPPAELLHDEDGPHLIRLWNMGNNMQYYETNRTSK